jgi:hypothetical protein
MSELHVLYTLTLQRLFIGTNITTKKILFLYLTLGDVAVAGTVGQRTQMDTAVAVAADGAVVVVVAVVLEVF